MKRLLGWDSQNFFQLPINGRNVGVGQIDLINHRHDGQALFVREMNVRDRLRFDPLGSVNQ